MHARVRAASQNARQAAACGSRVQRPAEVHAGRANDVEVFHYIISCRCVVAKLSLCGCQVVGVLLPCWFNTYVWT